MATISNEGRKDGLVVEPLATNGDGIRLSPSGFSTNGMPASASGISRQGLLGAAELPEDMDLQPPAYLARRLPDLGIAVKSILAFWLLYMVLLTMRGMVVQLPDFWD